MYESHSGTVGHPRTPRKLCGCSVRPLLRFPRHQLLNALYDSAASDAYGSDDEELSGYALLDGGWGSKPTVSGIEGDDKTYDIEEVLHRHSLGKGRVAVKGEA